MKKIISILLICIMIFSLSIPAFGDSKLSFSDVPKEHWAYDYVMKMVEKGYVQGTTKPINGVGTFRPDDTLTIAQLLTILVRAISPDEVEQLNKVNTVEHWYDNYYYAAINLGITPNFYFENLEELNLECDREMMAYYIVRTYEKVMGETVENVINLSEIPDYKDCSSLYLNSVLKAYSAGFLTGVDKEGTFKPKDSLTRAQACAVICRLLGLIKLEPQKNTKPLTTYNATLKGVWYPRSEFTFIDPNVKYTITDGQIIKEYLSGDKVDITEKSNYSLSGNTIYISSVAGYNPSFVNGRYTYQILNNVLTLRDSKDVNYSLFCENNKANSVSDLMLKYSKMVEKMTEMYYILDDYGYKIDKYNILLDKIDNDKALYTAEIKSLESQISSLESKQEEYEKALQEYNNRKEESVINGIEFEENFEGKPLTSDEQSRLIIMKNQKTQLEKEFNEYCDKWDSKYVIYDRELSKLNASYSVHLGELNGWMKEDLAELNTMRDYLSNALGYVFELNPGEDYDIGPLTFEDIRLFMKR